MKDRRRPQGACGAPQEGTPSAHSRLERGDWIFRERRGWCDAEILTPYTAPGSAARIPTSPFFFARHELPHSRFGFSIKKALGGAVVRNRIRRRVREIVRCHRLEIACRMGHRDTSEEQCGEGGVCHAGGGIVAPDAERIKTSPQSAGVRFALAALRFYKAIFVAAGGRKLPV